jgi:hypothetical protein
MAAPIAPSPQQDHLLDDLPPKRYRDDSQDRERQSTRVHRHADDGNDRLRRRWGSRLPISGGYKVGAHDSMSGSGRIQPSAWQLPWHACFAVPHRSSLAQVPPEAVAITAQRRRLRAAGARPRRQKATEEK